MVYAGRVVHSTMPPRPVPCPAALSPRVVGFYCLLPSGQADLDEEGERRLKQLLLVRRIYEKMLLSKLREDQKRCDLFEASFQRIRQSTGLTDVNDIADKFLSRHTTTENLLVCGVCVCAHRHSHFVVVVKPWVSQWHCVPPPPSTRSLPPSQFIAMAARGCMRCV